VAKTASSASPFLLEQCPNTELMAMGLACRQAAISVGEDQRWRGGGETAGRPSWLIYPIGYLCSTGRFRGYEFLTS
jgi:hypothetical protein